MAVLRYDTSSWRDRFPYGTLSLIALFYIMGIITYETGTFPTIDMGKFLIRDAIIITYALQPEPYTFQWQFFTYSFIHFGLVHYIYTGGLLLYFITGLERATSAKFVIISYYTIATISPFFIGIFAAIMITIFPITGQYFLVASYFFGSSVAIWGLIGLTAPISYRRRSFFPILFLLLIPELYLKFVAGRTDILTNTSHILVFLVCLLISSLLIDFENNDGRVGALNPTTTDDLWLKLLIIPHIIGLSLYFLQIVGYFPTTW